MTRLSFNAGHTHTHTQTHTHTHTRTYTHFYENNFRFKNVVSVFGVIMYNYSVFGVIMYNYSVFGVIMYNYSVSKDSKHAYYYTLSLATIVVLNAFKCPQHKKIAVSLLGEIYLELTSFTKIM